MSTHNLCFRAKIKKDVYPCTPQFHCIKVGCKGVFVTRTCFRDVYPKPCYIETCYTEVKVYMKRNLTILAVNIKGAYQSQPSWMSRLI